MKTIRELTKLNGGKELDIAYPVQLYNKDGERAYFEDSNGCWEKLEWKDGDIVRFENSEGYWYKNDYKDGKLTYFEDSNGYWEKYEYDRDGKQVYYESSSGYIIDNRETVDLTMEEVCRMAGKKVRIVE